ncbi:MAG: CoA transferase subunit A [Deltaproteobacteria bacterium]|nr:CoA transferase subunit A [Deltaproteobacteria bacterium]MBW2052056.1 CoA transferase subunit A [Deltaproteobacteria bacterium]MBW2140883.1 CoA transferase subunit A [Deltaproteobacteria bacterium]MBW2322096.1 CoA transferase subunit A [Deltaproteobacteria bacterium]
MTDNTINKVMTLKEAVSRFVHDGDELVVGNYTVATPFNQIMEVVRQEKKNLTVYTQSGVFDVEMLIAGECVDRIVTTYNIRSGGRGGGSMCERYQTAGKIQVEDYSNFTYNARLTAGALGYSFMPVLPGIMATDVFKVRDFMGESKFGVVECPFTGKDIPVVPAANPDVCIVHVHRADKYGNAQYWGAKGSVAWACLASKNIIVSCEELVDTEIINASPEYTILPSFRVNAVVEESFGAHPAELVGYYNMDQLFYIEMDVANASDTGLRKWMDEWVYPIPDRNTYIERYISKYGLERLKQIKAQTYYSAPVNQGAAFYSNWREDGKSVGLGLTLDEIEKVMEEKGLMIDV